MAAQVDSPFAYTATGLLGDQRPSMLQNELHLRNKVGQVKSRGYHLPVKGFTYGLPNDRRQNTAADATWNISDNSMNSDAALRGWSGTYLPKGGATRTKAASERDFMGLNRAAASDGLVKAEEYADYRATHDIRRLPFDKKEMAGKMRSRRLPPTMVFGIQSRPSTPIFDLIEHKYQDRWLKERHSHLSANRSAESKGPRSHGIVYETRASLLRHYQNPVDPPPLWQLPRFTKSAKPKIESFRTETQKSSAFLHMETDRIARQGDFGTGVYEIPKN
ncbi:cilia- and flagella-associated protein 77-like isoform X2 [Physella acuta]|uniref:cilia- and flagella-associated protein 77-like isoform X2 n=1 Tax=Physella acuta TaxID=109671 RepID=UPI0027DDA836|nr:cilia- and flagella-associated protein 77-like isoform X2 [Physella acuta]